MGSERIIYITGILLMIVVAIIRSDAIEHYNEFDSKMDTIIELLEAKDDP